jgi:hypothetical protein
VLLPVHVRAFSLGQKAPPMSGAQEINDCR